MKLHFSASVIWLIVAVSFSQETPAPKDCNTNHFVLHKMPCLCGKIQIASGDIGVDPVQMGLDEMVEVELRDAKGKPIESKRLSYRSEVPFCFSGKANGRYSLAFVLFEKGKPQPAAVFPTKYRGKSDRECASVNPIYLVPVICPK